MSQLIMTPSLVGYEETGLVNAKAIIYTGDGNDDRDITGVPFSPGLIWNFTRTGTNRRVSIIDVNRGPTHYFDNAASGADVVDADGIQAFNSSGFQVGTIDRFNRLNNTYGAWCFQKAVDEGLAIVDYVGDAVAGRTVAHGLGVIPEFFIVKTVDDVKPPQVFHKSMNGGTTPEDWYMQFNSDGLSSSNINRWNDTAPDATNITLGSGATNNKDGINFVLYAWAPIAGRSFFGGYTGTSAEKLITGFNFKPSMVMIKHEGGGGGSSDNSAWNLLDAARGSTKRKKFDQEAIEQTEPETIKSFDADGFTLGTDVAVNDSGKTYIFGAWR